MNLSYGTLKTLTTIGVLGVIGSCGYIISEDKKMSNNPPELVRVSEINSELRDISRVLDHLPIRVVLKNPDTTQHYEVMSQREERLQEEHDSLSALPNVHQALIEKEHHSHHTFYGWGGILLFGMLGAVCNSELSMRRRLKIGD